METVEEEPSEYEYEYKFGIWTAARLSEHLEKATRIKLSSEQVRRILKEQKYVYHWAKYSLEDKQNKKKREAFKEKLEGYIKASEESQEKIQKKNRIRIAKYYFRVFTRI